MNINRTELDNYITGRWGEDQFTDEDEMTTTGTRNLTDDQTIDLAEAVYTEVYGDIDSASVRDEKITEMYDWLIEVDADVIATWSVADLADEWRRSDVVEGA